MVHNQAQTKQKGASGSIQCLDALHTSTDTNPSTNDKLAPTSGISSMAISMLRATFSRLMISSILRWASGSIGLASSARYAISSSTFAAAACTPWVESRVGHRPKRGPLLKKQAHTPTKQSIDQPNPGSPPPTPPPRKAPKTLKHKTSKRTRRFCVMSTPRTLTTSPVSIACASSALWCDSSCGEGYV